MPLSSGPESRRRYDDQILHQGLPQTAAGPSRVAQYQRIRGIAFQSYKGYGEQAASEEAFMERFGGLTQAILSIDYIVAIAIRS